MSRSLTNKLRRMKRKSLIGQIVLLFLGIQILFLSAFVSFDLPTATGQNLSCYAHNLAVDFVDILPAEYQEKCRERIPDLAKPLQPVRSSSYVPLLPVSVGLAYVLGVPLAVVASLVFISFGLLGPQCNFYPFAAGGGLTYLREPGFGYLLGLLPASWITALIAGEERSGWRQIFAILSGVATFHIVGLAILFGGAIITLFIDGDKAFLQSYPWLSEQMRNLSWYVLPYDFFFSLLLVGVSFPIKWLVGVLISPDIAMRGRGQPLEPGLESS